MFVWGYCYTHGKGKTGFSPAFAKTRKAAEQAIKDRLAGKSVSFKMSEDGKKLRAYADGQPTDYIYFAQADADKDQYLLVDKGYLGIQRRRAVLKKGTLVEVKNAVRKQIESDVKEFGRKLKGVDFVKTTDNIKVVAATNYDAWETEYVILKAA